MLPGFLDNIILLCDSYKVGDVIVLYAPHKVSHYAQYPPGTETIYSYFESRGGKFPHTVFFGLQYVLKRALVGSVVSHQKIDEAKKLFADHFGREIFNEAGWRHIADHHKGYLPLRIKAVPEGSVIPTRNVLFTVENTDPKCYWLTNYVETILVQVWYPIAVATNSRTMKQLLAKYLLETSDNLDSLFFKLHDFGFRGVSSIESAALGGAAHLVNFRGTDTLAGSAALGGAAHLVNFRGTDTLAGVMLARSFYHCPMAGVSIPATEHSTMTVWGEECEVDAYKHLLDIYPTGTFACVSDSYNVWNACESIWGEKLRVQVKNRNGTLVIRPDSGDPIKVVPKVLDILGEKFKYTVNSKGYKVLPPFLRVIQGDGVSLQALEPILESIKAAGWSLENVAFGSGGALLQQLNRDTQKCAFKCSHAVVNGQPADVFKHPITDLQKTSKKGRLTLEYCEEQGDYITIEEGLGCATKDILVPVFENGVLLKDYSMDEIRHRAELPEVLARLCNHDPIPDGEL
ncbi:hypothetical protein T265_00471 [Opisthorchis viverrini]|uniref:Nicotinamide phosphoribosyltransferase n=1 Tax=Opisthorchis viverrini TaxID=6198 RepID=A0A075A655_OPIVI|nr:hypothetical protein T265_00471 [Opisthorchis viverrini]KER33807.1 hypothetical protein T265_00471 [Opisthorchis viverrini]